jgi:hypothetical protein
VFVVYCWQKNEQDNVEQCINYKFSVEIGRSASETLALLTLVYGEYTVLKKWSIFKWQRRFEEGQEDVQGDSRSAQPKS